MDKKTELQDHGGFIELRYNGRTVKVTCYINTRENATALAARIGNYIKDTGDCPMVIAFGIESAANSDAGNKLWNEIIAIARSGRTIPS